MPLLLTGVITTLQVSHQSNGTCRSAMQLMIKTLETRDIFTKMHADRVRNSITELGVALGLPESRIKTLRLLARFHDIGKIGISESILLKKEPLTSYEYAELQRHCVIGYQIAQTVPGLQSIADCILKHHEWWNSNGYPLGIKGEDIPFECRILAVVDAYDAMITNRPYRKALSIAEAGAELANGAGKQFDPGMVRVFLRLIADQQEGPRHEE